LGVWGTGIFQDDTACDIRDDYKDHVGNGLTGPDATTRILAEYKSSLADPHEANVVWLPLAAVQWKLGRLDADTVAMPRSAPRPTNHADAPRLRLSAQRLPQSVR